MTISNIFTALCNLHRAFLTGAPSSSCFLLVPRVLSRAELRNAIARLIPSKQLQILYETRQGHIGEKFIQTKVKMTNNVYYVTFAEAFVF